MPRALSPRSLPEAHQQVVAIPVQLVQPSPTNPRKDFGALDELAASMQAHGLLQPVIVRARGRRYELIAGHRRLAAARSLGWQTIPALVREADIEQGDVLQMVENLQRQDLLPEEEAVGLAGLMHRHNWSTRQVAQAIKRSQTYVSKRVRVYEDAVLRKAVLEGGLAPSTAEELLPLDSERRGALVELALQQGWGVAEVREAVRSATDPGAPRALRRRGEGFEEQVGAPAGPVRPVRTREGHHGAEARGSRGLTGMLKALRAVLRRVVPQDLSEAERRELRLLFMDLSLIARANPTKREIVIPPLPVTTSRR